MSTPPTRLEDRDGSAITHLWNPQENSAERRSSPDIHPVYSDDSEDTFIVSLEESSQIQLGGEATAFRIAQQSQYSNDPLTALAEWSARLLAHVNGQQGTGWTLYNDYTNRQLIGIVEKVELSRKRSEKYQVDWDLTLRVGSGMMPHQPLDPVVADPSNAAFIDNQEMHEIEELTIEKKQEVELHAYALHDYDENEIEGKSGAMKTITARGSIPGSETYRKDFDDHIRSRIGENYEVTYDSAFPGDSLDAVVTNYSATREAGTTQIGGYRVEMTEGTIGSNQGPVQ